MRDKNVFNRIIAYLGDQSIEIRIRMMYFLEYAAFVACLIGTIFMVLLKQPIVALIPNVFLFLISLAGLYFSVVKKKYDISALIMIIGCANTAVPWMFFVAGGNNSGMHMWFIFSVVVTCMLATGKMRIFMATITIIEDVACICIGQLFPDVVKPLVGENAAFIDELQSFAIVCVCTSIMVSIFINTYDNQSKKLETQSIELTNMMKTDALTKMFNRHAYYEEINLYKNGQKPEDMVLVAMDVNGLKKINDMFGHASGDDYIVAAANVINKAMGQYGHIFRTGGDEFMAILHCSVEEAYKLEKQLTECIAHQDNSWVDSMSIAIGVVCCEENSDVDIVEIEKLADKRMYENKAAYYKNKGIDRRK